MLAKIFGVCVALFIIFVVIPSFAIGLVIWWNFVHYIFFEPSRNECGEIDECIGTVISRIVMIFMVMVQTRSVNGKI